MRLCFPHWGFIAIKSSLFNVHVLIKISLIIYLYSYIENAKSKGTEKLKSHVEQERSEASSRIDTR